MLNFRAYFQLSQFSSIVSYVQSLLSTYFNLGFVNNFGQIPTQLFKKPHPQKKVSPVDGFSNTPGVTTQRLFYHCLHSLKPPQNPIRELRSAVGSIYQSERAGLIVLEQNKVLIGTNKYIAWGFPDRSLRLGQIDSDKSLCIHEMCDADELTCVASGDDRTLFCGSSTGCVSGNLMFQRVDVMPKAVFPEEKKAIRWTFRCCHLPG
ncbi:unnamed protein product [Strongylus vulgaris]|uniref:BEACH domain-containing protein n=1 Tax=Strongylus vulgaris TaxID=40348 RepID=A0A3P7IW52_STRVU|nr:unnamed protein product [Strongylus vulgaris]